MKIVNNNMENMEEIKEQTVVNTEQQEKDAPTYGDLKNWCDQLMMQRNQLAERLSQITDIHNKLPWLFKVLENKEMFKNEFVNSCVEEITYIMTPPVPEQPEQSEEPNKEEPKE